MKFPGAAFADFGADGPRTVPPGAPGTVAVAPRISRSGQKWAVSLDRGHGNPDDVYEWADGKWTRKGHSDGPFAVIYRGEELLIHNSKPQTGFRYIAPDGTPVTATETYADPVKQVWEYTVLPNGWIVGHGGKSQYGEDPLVILPGDGTRRLVRTGQCRFINAYLVGQRIDLAWSEPGGCDALSLSLAEVLALPAIPLNDVTTTPPPVPPNPETPMQLPENVKAIIRSFAAKFPLPQTPGGGAAHEDACRQWTRKAIEQVVYSTGDESWGHKRSAGEASKDSIARQLINMPHQPAMRLVSWDVMDGAGTGTPVLNLDGVASDITGQTFIPVPPVNHLGASPPTPNPTPTPSPSGSIDALVASQIKQAVAPLVAELAALKLRVAELEQAQPVPNPSLERIALRSAHGRYGSVQPDGSVIFDRHGIGPWEILTVEEVE